MDDYDYLKAHFDRIVAAQRDKELRALASAMRKMLPPALLAEVVAHLDPLTAFVEALRTVEGA